jgi:hypothetical protein
MPSVGFFFSPSFHVKRAKVVNTINWLILANLGANKECQCKSLVIYIVGAIVY